MFRQTNAELVTEKTEYSYTKRVGRRKERKQKK